MVLEGGLDWKTMALSPRDMDFIELKNAAAREIALAFGVPPMLLGIPGDNTYANLVGGQPGAVAADGDPAGAAGGRRPVGVAGAGVRRRRSRWCRTSTASRRWPRTARRCGRGSGRAEFLSDEEKRRCCWEVERCKPLTHWTER